MVPSLVDDQQHTAMGSELVEDGEQAGFVLGWSFVVDRGAIGGQCAAVVGGFADVESEVRGRRWCLP